MKAQPTPLSTKSVGASDSPYARAKGTRKIKLDYNFLNFPNVFFYVSFFSGFTLRLFLWAAACWFVGRFNI